MKRTHFLFIMLNSLAFGQRADFFREDITFRLDGIYLDVDGYYWFTNHSAGQEVHSEIFYPFPVGADGKVDSIRLDNISTARKVKYRLEGGHGISCNLFIAPLDTVLFRIGYRQQIDSDSVGYILTTTQGWGKPLALAEFKLITPDSVSMKGCSYPPNKTYHIENERIYYWKMENFMPDRDMVFHF
jgi:hypothetical protein